MKIYLILQSIMINALANLIQERRARFLQLYRQYMDTLLAYDLQTYALHKFKPGSMERGFLWEEATKP